VFESFFGIPGLGAFVIEAIGGQGLRDRAPMVFVGDALLHRQLRADRHCLHVGRPAVRLA
jgi:peptide/nickel transport system permease protein